LPTRVLAVAAVAIVLAAAGAYALRPPRGVPKDAPTERAMADAVGAQIMSALRRGHVPGRSGDVSLIAKPYSFLTSPWDLTSLGTSSPWLSTTHPAPWAYVARIPLILWGPGYVPSHRRPYERVDPADLAPTYADLLGLRGFKVQGHPLSEIVRASRGRPPPRAIVTVVIDGGGWDALQEHSGSWPTIARLAREGTSYQNATNGSAPSITGAIHATFGTGDYPQRHGLPGNQLRTSSGRIEDAWLDDADPRFLRALTLSDVWDRATNNKSIAAAVAFDGWHEEKSSWWINKRFYELPSYLNPGVRAALRGYERGLDGRDGYKDGKWFGHTLSYLRQPTVRPGTPAFVELTGDAVAKVLQHEPIGRDRIPDLLWIEYKTPDFAGHLWNMVNPEEGDILKEVDRQIARLKSALDRKLGVGHYVLAISADHGQQPLPDERGGWRIDASELQSDIDARFGAVVQRVTPSDMYLNRSALARTCWSNSDQFMAKSPRKSAGTNPSVV
jgi:predicted AlkP superfamily pyrophosphatase or phosphodiesterase